MEKLILRDEDPFLIHSGTMGQRWYVRNYQNYDGSLTEEGRRHYGVGPPRKSKAEIKAEKKEARRQEKIKAKRAANLKKAQKAKMMAKKQEEAAAKKQAKIDAEKQRKATELAKRKQQLYIDGDLNELYKNRKLFTTEEYQEAVRRAELFNRTKPNEPVPVVKENSNKMQTGKLYIPEQKKADTGGLSERRKAQIINSGDPKLIKANMRFLSDSELKSAIERMKTNAELSKNSKDVKAVDKVLNDRKTKDDGKAFVDSLSNSINKVTTLGNNAVNAYNTYNKLATAVNNVSGKNSLPVFKIIKTDSDKSKSKDDDDDQNQNQNQSNKNKNKNKNKNQNQSNDNQNQSNKNQSNKNQNKNQNNSQSPAYVANLTNWMDFDNVPLSIFGPHGGVYTYNTKPPRPMPTNLQDLQDYETYD